METRLDSTELRCAQLSSLLLLAGACCAAADSPPHLPTPRTATAIVPDETPSTTTDTVPTISAPSVGSSAAFTAAVAPTEDAPLQIDLARAIPANESCTTRPTPFALSILVDRSGSMSGVPMETAKKALHGLLTSLQPNEALEVIAFDAMAQRAVELSCGSQRNEATTRIDAITPGGGTELLSPLKMAFIDLTATSAARKHIVLITDGRGPVEGVNELAAIMASSGISVSTIGIGADTDGELLRSLASTTGGTFHAVVDPKELVAALAKDVAAARRPAKH